MDLFNIGTGELLVLALLAIVLFGPEDMVRMARTLGRYTRMAREAWETLTRQLDREIMSQEQLQRAMALDKELRASSARSLPAQKEERPGKETTS